MHKFTKGIIIGMTALGLGIGGSYSALAQMPPSDSAGMTSKTGMMQSEKHGERMKDHMAKRAKRQADLHTKLKLSAAQEPAWKTYTDSMKPADMKDRPDRAAMKKMPAPQRMEAMLERMKQGQSRMESHLAALKTFYATLTPEQQKTFDAEFGQGRGHRGHRGGGMMK